ncbi:hypothetical protein [Alicycliphilus denitrificans]|uniref:hypothetical protein n=1 Tax=Alicycliphilus denitrificans TaxID=179636 RepID=UPI001C7D2948|nr:hypothetical protein [Alicycliphilus denitrificans]
MNLTRKTIVLLVCASLGLAGCATSSKDIASTYVSPVQYQGYDCDQIAAENQRLATRVSQLGGRLDEASSNDKAIMGVGLVLFWPALFALGGTKQQEAEYARLKGEHDALQQAAVAKKCTMMTAKNDAPAAVMPAAPTVTATAAVADATGTPAAPAEQP